MTESARMTPASSAAATVNGFIVEPGSKTSVTARLRSCPARLERLPLGLNDGWLTIARTSPLRTSSSTSDPETAR